MPLLKEDELYKKNWAKENVKWELADVKAGVLGDVQAANNINALLNIQRLDPKPKQY
jgi:hypothetical protein